MATLPPIRTSFLHPWPPHLTPPMSITMHTRPCPTLQPIAPLDPRRVLETYAPGTPPNDIHAPQPPRLPPLQSHPRTPIPQPLDWFDLPRTRSAHSIAEKTCEMICYLWFAQHHAHQRYPSPDASPPFASRSNAFASTSTTSPITSTSTQQLVASPTFVQFMQKVLETTQVSQSVIVLSLHYIYRLKERNRFTPAQSGSEFRIAVAALMMANKFLDDNTYTNKTWSEVSGIGLDEINRMEREFLMGVDFNLYVDKPTYESWLNLLKGLIMSKERECHRFRRSRAHIRAARFPHPTQSAGLASRTHFSKYLWSAARARSSSPECRLAYPFSALRDSPVAKKLSPFASYREDSHFAWKNYSCPCAKDYVNVDGSRISCGGIPIPLT